MLRVLPAIVLVLLLFVFGAVRIGNWPEHQWYTQDKLQHFLAFGVLAILVLSALQFEIQTKKLTLLVTVSVVVSSLLGALLEAWQRLFPSRMPDWGDWCADTLGALAFGVAALVWMRWRARRQGEIGAGSP